jgi:CysZ protein
MFTRAFARTLRTTRSPHFMGLLMKTALITLLVFILFVAGFAASMRSFDLTQGGWMEWALDILLTFGAGFMGWMLLPILVPAIAAFFQETIANSIERQDYPDYMPPAAQRPFVQELVEDFKFVLLIVVVNLVFFVTYFIPIVGLFTYYGVNGYLIGREFFETAAARHIGKKKAKALRREFPAPAFLCGALIVLCTNVPFLNLIAPFIGVAIMVHLYHLLPKKEEYLPPMKEVV